MGRGAGRLLMCTGAVMRKIQGREDIVRKRYKLDLDTFEK